MTLCRVILLIGVVAVLWSGLGASQDLDESDGCTLVSVSDEKQVAHSGWPYLLDCNLALDVFYYAYGDEEDEINCQILLQNGSILFNTTLSPDTIEYYDYEEKSIGLILPTLNKNSTFKYDIIVTVIKTGECYVAKLNLNVVQLQESCQDLTMFNFKLSSRNEWLTEDGEQMLKLPLTCDVTIEEEYPKLHLDGASGTVTYKWLRNCSNELPQNVAMEPGDDSLFHNVAFEHAGVYICAVTYNGMTRYVDYREICVSHPLSYNAPTLRCSSDVVYHSLGDNAMFDCSANFGTGDVQSLMSQFISIKWKKVSGNQTDCLDSSVDTNETTFCKTFVEQRCSLGGAEYERAPAADVPIQLFVRNIQPEDFGQYNIIVSISQDSIVTLNVTVTLEENPIPSILSTTQVIAISIGAVVFLLLVGFLLWMNALYFRVWFKRTCGPYETMGGRNYAAILSYHVSDALNPAQRVQMTTAADTLRNEVERCLQYTMFDVIRDARPGEGRAAEIRMNIQGSHRVIVILNTKFTQDDWNVRVFQEGFMEMIQREDVKLIFVVLPNVIQHAKIHSPTDPTWAALRAAMQTNYVIQWPRSSWWQRHRFRYQVEDAMPKLKPHDGAIELTRV